MADEILNFRFQNLHEFVKIARQNLDRNNWDYLIGGSESDTTLARNRLALDSPRVRPPGAAPATGQTTRYPGRPTPRASAAASAKSPSVTSAAACGSTTRGSTRRGSTGRTSSGSSGTSTSR